MKKNKKKHKILIFKKCWKLIVTINLSVKNANVTHTLKNTFNFQYYCKIFYTLYGTKIKRVFF